MSGSSSVRLQARIGNAVAGSLFAIAQSIPMRRAVRITTLRGSAVVMGGAFAVLALLLGPL